MDFTNRTKKGRLYIRDRPAEWVSGHPVGARSKPIIVSIFQVSFNFLSNPSKECFHNFEGAKVQLFSK
jgi:hypothetical protein